MPPTGPKLAWKRHAGLHSQEVSVPKAEIAQTIIARVLERQPSNVGSLIVSFADVMTSDDVIMRLHPRATKAADRALTRKSASAPRGGQRRRKRL
jgi:hypothetical protein